jgi:DNA-binding transcriptional regulator YiaG
MESMTTTDLRRLTRVRRLAETGEARRIREAARLGLGEVARSLGVSGSTLHRWEQGLRSPRGGKALMWCDLLDDLVLAGDRR